MSDFPGASALPLHIGTFSRFSVFGDSRTIASTATPAAITWVANTAVYMPFSIPWPYPVFRFWWMNGSTAGSNIDMGIYTLGGARLVSLGSTGQGTLSVLTYSSTLSTPFILPAGQYLLAYNCDGTTSRAYGVAPTAAQGAMLGCMSQAVGAIALPATATFATYGAPGITFCGITRTSSGF